MKEPAAPDVTDPVVVEGTKYRIRTIEDDVWTAKTSFGGLTTSGRVEDLVWDKVAGVWRVR